MSRCCVGTNEIFSCLMWITPDQGIWIELIEILIESRRGLNIMKILLVDDSRTIRNIQKNVLAQLGHTDTIEANDGVEALQLLAQGTPDLVLVDWN
ncbi:MAG: response regulator, partial [Phycisphaerae bacterium]|nr:response regulator [Phycisphaerae bacterium]